MRICHAMSYVSSRWNRACNSYAYRNTLSIVRGKEFSRMRCCYCATNGILHDKSARKQSPNLGARKVAVQYLSSASFMKKTLTPKYTPMIQQYLERKREHPDCLLLFQVGDFYELFGEDARKASHLLNLVLTSKWSKKEYHMEMCGFPLVSLDSFVQKLVLHHGLKVAICNQIRPRKTLEKKNSKYTKKNVTISEITPLIDRQIVRIVTPGSLVEDSMLTPNENNYLCAIHLHERAADGDIFDFAWADLSTGEFRAASGAMEKISGLILRCAPKEILIPNFDNAFSACASKIRDILRSSLPQTCMKTYRSLASFSNVDQGSREGSRHTNAAAAIVNYIQYAYNAEFDGSVRLNPLQHVSAMDHMTIDQSAWKALELTASLSGNKSASLFHAINKTVTSAGSRLLASHLSSPLMQIDTLKDRHDAVQYLRTLEIALLRPLRVQLSEIPDLERSTQRLALGVGAPKDLRNIAVSLKMAIKIAELCMNSESSTALPNLLHRRCAQFADTGDALTEIIARITAAVRSEDSAEGVPFSLSSRSGFVRAGFSKELDEWRSIAMICEKSSKSTALMKQKLQAKYRESLRSTRVRVLYQNGRGFFLEMPIQEYDRLSQLQKETKTEAFQQLILSQSLKTTMRFRTDELSEMNFTISEAIEQVQRLESEIFEYLAAFVLSESDTIHAVAKTMAILDVACSQAKLALDCHFTRPIMDHSREMHVEHGRHCVVEAAHWRGQNNHLQSQNSSNPRAFVPNSLHLEPCTGTRRESLGACCFISGPNMGGKSTYLRQNAQIAVLAQMGSFVPARFARIGLIDRIFCRVGSADDLASDKSTFMVEMQETASILKHATAQSLVIMDEVGRGTCVEDGIAIAGAVLESLCREQIRTLFASHFTMLPQLLEVSNAAHRIKAPQLFRVEVLEMRESVEDDRPSHQRSLAFTHRVVPGLAAQSFGLNTAALAGCPPSIITRAWELQQSYRSMLEGAENARSSQLNDEQRFQIITEVLGLPANKFHTTEAERLIERLRKVLSDTGNGQLKPE